MKKLCVLCITILIIILTIALPGCDEKEATPEYKIPAHFTTYTEEGLFSISYPADWETALHLLEGLEQDVKEVITSIESDINLEKASMIFIAGLPAEMGYEPNINIVVESLPGIIWTHDELVEASIRGLKTVVKNYRTFFQVKTTIDGRETTILSYEGSFP